MPVFIRRRAEQHEQKDGTVVVTHHDYTKAELKELRAEHPSKFIEVSESHAADVIRPQGNYQEVADEPEHTAADVQRHAAQSQQGAGKGRSGSSTGRGGSNRGNGRSQR